MLYQLSYVRAGPGKVTPSVWAGTGHRCSGTIDVSRQRRPSLPSSPRSPHPGGASRREALLPAEPPARAAMIERVSKQGRPMAIQTTTLEEIAQALVAPGKGILAADESERHDQEALRRDRRRVDRGEPARLPRPALHDRGRGGVHQRRHPLRRDDPPERSGRDAVPEAPRAPGDHPGDQGRQGREAARACAPGETVTEGLDGLRERLAGVPRARRAVRQVARGDLDRRRASRASTASGRTRTRSRATRRWRRKPASCRSSSPRC